jgi:hypothetical protein
MSATEASVMKSAGHQTICRNFTMTPLEKLKENVRAALGETPFVIAKAVLRNQHLGMSDGEFEKTWQISTEEYRWQFLVGVCDGLKG